MMTIATPYNGFEVGGDNSAPEHIQFENPVSESPMASDSGSNTAVPSVQNAAPALAPISENPPEKKSRSYTKRVEIGGKCVMVTLHHGGIELRAKYGRQRAEWSFEKLWDAAEGKLL